MSGLCENAGEAEKQPLENDYKEQIERKDQSMIEKGEDKKKASEDTSFMSFSCDLQCVGIQVLQIPSSRASFLYYLRKLTVFNFTIYEAANPNEINRKRGSCEIGSCLLNFVNNHVPRVNHIFSDTCGGQNRNVQIMAL
uniref:Uncharacterized protein n=1 Tax=Cacopsylla melanoneura TaxID=428564 RepID=A0A8D8Q7M9_9HEMI